MGEGQGVSNSLFQHPGGAQDQCFPAPQGPQQRTQSSSGLSHPDQYGRGRAHEQCCLLGVVVVVRMFWGETERYVYQSLVLSCLCFLWLQGTR